MQEDEPIVETPDQPIAEVDDRDRMADDRDDTSDAHDLASQARDERAQARDERAEMREEASDNFDAGAASDRAGARRDRQGGANDRRHAEHDRQAASTDRALSARERAAFLVDGLTGAHRREAGLMELEREISRAKRTLHPFALAFIDVDGLKRVNDSQGHAAGDQFLCDVVDATRRHVRSYDLIVRLGGDEFLCGLSDLTGAQAAERFALVNADLAAGREGSITAGIAELMPDDTLDDLIDRADVALYEHRDRPETIPA